MCFFSLRGGCFSTGKRWEKEGDSDFLEKEEFRILMVIRKESKVVVIVIDVRGDGIFFGYFYKEMEKEGFKFWYCVL